MLTAIRSRARRGEVAYDLTDRWLAGKIAAGCELTGIPFDLSPNGFKSHGPFTPSVDRKTAGAGYTQANCRVICSALNAALGDWGLDTFLPIAEALISRQGRAARAA